MQIPASASQAFPLKKSGQTADTAARDAELKKACQGFEAIILQQMLSSMRKSLPKNGLTSGGYAQDMYQSMADEALAQHLAAGKGMGLADALYHQLTAGVPHSRKA